MQQQQAPARLPSTAGSITRIDVSSLELPLSASGPWPSPVTVMRH